MPTPSEMLHDRAYPPAARMIRHERARYLVMVTNWRTVAGITHAEVHVTRLTAGAALRFGWQWLRWHFTREG